MVFLYGKAFCLPNQTEFQIWKNSDDKYYKFVQPYLNIFLTVTASKARYKRRRYIKDRNDNTILNIKSKRIYGRYVWRAYRGDRKGDKNVLFTFERDINDTTNYKIVLASSNGRFTLQTGSSVAQPIYKLNSDTGICIAEVSPFGGLAEEGKSYTLVTVSAGVDYAFICSIVIMLDLDTRPTRNEGAIMPVIREQRIEVQNDNLERYIAAANILVGGFSIIGKVSGFFTGIGW